MSQHQSSSITKTGRPSIVEEYPNGVWTSISAYSTPALRDPVVRIVHAGADDHGLDRRIARHCDGAVGDDEDFEGGALERVALGDAINLLLHRAGVGVDVDGDRDLGFYCRLSRPRAAGIKCSLTTLAPL